MGERVAEVLRSDGLRIAPSVANASPTATPPAGWEPAAQIVISILNRNTRRAFQKSVDSARYSFSPGSIAQSGCALLRSLYSSTFVDFDKRNPRNDFPWKRQVCAIARRSEPISSGGKFALISAKLPGTSSAPPMPERPWQQ
jgi:hypothetical protein